MTTFFKDIRATIALGIPLVLAQVCMMAMSMTDAIIVGRGVGTEALAALSFALNFMNIPFIALYGLSSATSIYVAHAYGSGKTDELPSILRHGIIICFIMAVAVAGGMLWFFEHLEYVNYLGQPKELMPIARQYVYYYNASFVFQLCAGNCRAYCESQNRPWLPFYVVFGTIFLNAVMDYGLVNGVWGFPKMGIAGAGLATLICAMVQFFGLVAVIICNGKLNLTLRQLMKPMLDRVFVKKHLKIGVPTALQIGVEIGAMSVMAMFAGQLGTTTLAAHHVTMQIVGFLFMIPMGMSFAVSIRISQASGAGDRGSVLRICRSGLAFAVAWMSFSAVILLSLHNYIPMIFTHDMGVVKVAGGFLIVAGCFQIFDGLQCTAIGALRGLKDVAKPMLIVIAVYWIVEMPLGWYLCFRTPLAGNGIWLGMLVGLAILAACLILRLNRVTKKAQLRD
jgi:multidrug resistance protein, MATE family